MATGTIFDVSTVPLTLVLSYKYDDPPQWKGGNQQPDSVEFTLSIKKTDTITTTTELKAVTTLAVPQSINLSFNLADPLDPLSLRLISCAGKVLIKPLIECLNVDSHQYLICLKSKGLSIAVEIVGCVLGCLTLKP
ncbi:MAG: hypothetical protein IPL99_01305 [Candidatus Competibacteraceae bacterium]|nr:hypothetical protein [Candidatus Competibacteraceae bacterium]